VNTAAITFNYGWDTIHKLLPKAIEAFEEIYVNEPGANEQGKNDHQKRIECLIHNSSIHQLEYCLALHAEENAILQTAKVGGVTMKGGTIYVTAHPCPLCAKKIQQVGIRKVVYTDPYPESLPDVFMANVELEQFEGVKPRAYIKLFMPHHYCPFNLKTNCCKARIYNSL